MAPRPFRFVVLSAIALAVAALLIALLLQTRPDGNEAGPEDGIPRESLDTAAAARVASRVAGDATDDPSRIEASTAHLSDAIREGVGETVVFRGKLVVLETGQPPRNARVGVRTGRDPLDSTFLLDRAGGRRAYDDLVATGEIELLRRGDPLGRCLFRTAARADGTFELQVPKSAGRFCLEAISEDAALANPLWYSLSPENLHQLVVVRLAQAGSLEGKLVDEKGDPVGPGWVAIESERTYSSRRPSLQQERTLEVDASGRFTVHGLAPGRVNVAALAEGRAFGTEPFVKIERGKATAVELQLSPEVPFEGQVVDPDGRGVEGIAVRLTPRNRLIQGLGFGIARSDAQGKLRWRNLAAGSYFARITATGWHVVEGVENVQVPGGASSKPPRWVVKRGHFVAGRVVHADGSPAVDVQLWGSSWSESGGENQPRGRQGGARTRSDATGAFRLEGLPEGPLQISAVLERFSRQTEVNVPADKEDLVITLPGKTGIAGLVVDAATDKPIPAFTVRTVDADYAARFAGDFLGWGGNDTAFVSEPGTFEHAEVPPGVRHVRVFADGYAPCDVKDVTVKSGELASGLVFKLAAATRIVGKVVEAATGKPIAGAEVEFLASDAVETGVRETGERTLPDGTFELEVPPAAQGRIYASHERFVEARTETFELRRGERNEAPVVELGTGGVAIGIAVDRSGAVAPRAVIQAYFSEARNPQPRKGWKAVVADRNGEFRLEGLIPGAWVVNSNPAAAGDLDESGQNRTVSGKVTVAEGLTSVVEFKIPKSGGCTIHGRVTRGGEPVSGGNINLWPNFQGSVDSLDASSGNFSTQLSSEGRFKIEHVPAGSMQVHVSVWSVGQGAAALAPGSHTGYSTHVDVPDAPELLFDIEIPAGCEVHGRVTSRASGKPLSGIGVNAYGKNPKDPTGGSTNVSATTGRDGRYRLTGLPPGSVHLNVGPKNGGFGASPELQKYTRVARTIEVTEGATVTADFALEEGATVVVEVIGEDGKPVPQSWVNVAPREPPAGWSGSYGSTNELGLATIHGIPEGRARATCQVEGYPPAKSDEFTAAIGAPARTRITLTRGVEVRIRVLGPDGAPLKPLWINLAGADGTDGGNAYRGNPGQPTDGTLKVTTQPGAYRAYISFENGASAQADLEVGTASGAVVDVKLAKMPSSK